MDVELLTQADFVLDKCGRPRAPKGLSIVYLYKAFLIQQAFPVTPATPQQTIVKEITGDVPWCLRAIQLTSSATTSLRIQVLLPNGRFLINDNQDVLQIAGYGSYRYLFEKELKCPPGSKLQVTFIDTNTAVAQPIAMLLEGAYAYLLKSTTDQNQICPVDDAASLMPRYFRNFNENIMAACWMQGMGPAFEPDANAKEWVYAAQAPTPIDVANGPFTATQQVPIDSGTDFKCRRLLFAITADATVTAGTILCRIRTGSGYAFTNDYFDVATYIGSAPMPKDWDIAAGDTVYLDMQVVDQTGTGNIYLQTYLEGAKVKKAA